MPTENLGHFGLNLSELAHFTSPIRRYSDLIVHRALIRALDLGPDGMIIDQDRVRLEEMAEHVTMTERRSMAAEREATDRYLAIYMADRVGAIFDARIAGVTRGWPVRTRRREQAQTGSSRPTSLGEEVLGLRRRPVPPLSPSDRPGAPRWASAVQVELMEATPVAGGLLFSMPIASATAPHRSSRRRARRRPPRQPCAQAPA